MVDWWSESEHAIAACLGSNGPMSPENLAQRVGISECETTAFLCMLAREKQISIRLVGLKGAPAGQPTRGVALLRGKGPAQRQTAYAGGH